MGKPKHDEPLPNIGRKRWGPGDYRRNAGEEDSPEGGPGRMWDGRVKHLDVLGNYFPENFEYPESIDNDGHGPLAKRVGTPKARASRMGRPIGYGGGES